MADVSGQDTYTCIVVKFVISKSGVWKCILRLWSEKAAVWRDVGVGVPQCSFNATVSSSRLQMVSAVVAALVLRLAADG